MDEGADAQRLRVVRADAQRDAGMVQRGGPVLGMKSTAKEALLMAPGGMGVGDGVIRVQPQGLLEEAQGLVGVGRRVRESMRQRPQVEIVGVEAVGPLAARPFYFGAPQGGLE